MPLGKSVLGLRSTVLTRRGTRNHGHLNLSPSILKTRKGFYTATPLLGTVIFLTAALLAALLVVENDATIAKIRATDDQDKLQFIAGVIMADSYNVLLQYSLESLTSKFLKDDYFDINTNESDWQHSVKNNLENHYLANLGPTLGLNAQAYAKAYESMPDVDKCEVVPEEEFSSETATKNSDRGDGTIEVRSMTLGERVRCTSLDPEGNVTVDITGRYYRVNIRVPTLYEMARWTILKAKEIINTGAADIPEPIAKYSSGRWVAINKDDNKLQKPGDVNLRDIADDWDSLMNNWLSGIVKDLVSTEAQNRGYTGMSLVEFLVKQEKERVYNLSDFEVSCAEIDKAANPSSYRNCMPVRVHTKMGDKECSGMEPPKTPDNSNPNPLYNLQSGSLYLTCSGGSCPGGMTSVMKEILAPLGSVCLNYYNYVDSVHPVCKKWEGKAKSVLLKGVLEDDNANYVYSGDTETTFRFKDPLQNTNTDSIKSMRLKCGENPGRDPEKNQEDIDLYKENVRVLLTNMDIKIGAGKDPNSEVILWSDKGSSISSVQNQDLRDMYGDIYGHSALLMTCFLGEVISDQKCSNQALKEKPRMQIQLDWDEVRANCINRINDLCDGLCGGSAVSSYTDSFCKSLFPPEGENHGARGLLVCSGKPSCGNTYVQIESVTFGVAGMQE